MQEPKQIYFSLLHSLPFSRKVPALIKSSKLRIIFPFYHTVSDEDQSFIKHLYPYKGISAFMEDLDFLLKYFLPLSVDDLHNNKYDTDKNYFVLSFDDGLRKMFDVVRPLLKQKGIPAIFFINSAFTDNKDLFYRYKVSLIIDELKNTDKRNSIKKILKDTGDDEDYLKKKLLSLTYTDLPLIDNIAKNISLDFNSFLKKNAPYMSSPEIEHIIRDGFHIGAHSHDHPLYAAVPKEDQLYQTQESISFIKKKFNTDKNYFAYPFSADGADISIFETMPIEYRPDLVFGTAGLRQFVGKKIIERIPMEIKNYSAQQIITYEYSWNLLKRTIGKK